MSSTIYGESKPRVSVVIIFLNAANFIEEAIASVFAQSYSDWELILVDDGSTDASTSIAREYAQFPNRVRYVEHAHHENRGMSASRNLGVRHANGEYIAFLDADDVWFANTLSDQVAILDSCHEAAMVYGPIQYWHSWTDKINHRQHDYVERLGVPANTLIQPPTLVPLFLRDHAAVPSGILIRREIVERIGGFEEQFRGEYEDQVFCAKICLHAPVFAADRCWYRYRQHADSCVSIGQTTGNTDAARRFFLHWLADYLTSQHVNAPDVWWTLKIETWRFTHPRIFRWIQQAERINRHAYR